ncbi:hypothetical protein [Pseudoclavibacter sp. JAI123]|uniref:dual OB domain-containing protein n=1 Tax=Pseudoclavibacter sp. JAI123 TaxID=2723065 RepID=UPI0035B6416F
MPHQPGWKTPTCLANSRNLSGRCVAGKETRDGRPAKWVRLISGQGEASEHERQFENGSDHSFLDRIDVPLPSAQPTTYQSENWLLDPTTY